MTRIYRSVAKIRGGTIKNSNDRIEGRTVDADDKVDFYLRPAASEEAEVVEMAHSFTEIIRDEDYVMGENQQSAAESGAVDHLVFGRNEPALHHYHQTYRRLLDQPPLPLLHSIS